MAIYITKKDKVVQYCTDLKLDKAVESILDRTDAVKAITHEGYRIKIVEDNYDDRIASDAIDKLSRIKSIVNSDVYIQEDVLRYKMIVDILNQEGV